MKYWFKSIALAILPRFANKIRAANLLLDSRDSYLEATGWMRSFLYGTPCKSDGTPIPWMNYSFLSFLESRLNATHTVFEFGCGFSTKFYASKACRVFSVEHDNSWLYKISQDLPKNAKLISRSLDEGCSYVDRFVEHAHEGDVGVVDGRRRVACCEVAIRNMKPSAVLILDDSNRSKYEEVFTIAVKAGFKLIRFQGLKPTGHCIEETTVFYRMNNCFGL